MPSLSPVIQSPRHSDFRAMPDQAITVKCPDCGHEFPLSDAVLGSVREDLANELEAKVREREKSLRAREDALRKRRSEIDDEVEAQLSKQLAEVEARAARKAADAQETRLKGLQEELGEKEAALKKAREHELELARRERQLKEAQEQLQLELERKLNEEREKLKVQIAKQEAERQALQHAELQKKLSDAVKMNDELRRKLEQGSQQTQGEVLELDIENRLKALFPLDRFSEVPKGIRGADLVHTVANALGQPCGSILYETKRSKAWSRDWIPKLKKDLVTARADVAVLVTETLPDGLEHCELLEGVWVVPLAGVIPLVHSLRWSLQQVARAAAAREGVQDKQALLYQYFTGNEFRHRMETVLAGLRSMQDDLEREKRALTKHWAKREKQLESVVLNLSGMSGDIQGIAGGELEKLAALDDLLESDE